MRVLVTGGLGLLGTRILELWGDKFEVVVVDKEANSDHPQQFKTDLTALEDVAAVMYDTKPDWVVHMAAFTDVEKAETEKEFAYQVNVTATDNLVTAARDQGSRLLYFSTGFVFDGKKEKYQDDDERLPVNYYGTTKLAGEAVIEQSGLEFCIIRPNYPFRTKWEKKSDTVRWMVDKLQLGENIDLVVDQKISPTFIDDLSSITAKIMANNITGVYNTASPDCLSFYEIGLQVAGEFGFDKDLISSVVLEKYLKDSGKKSTPPKNSCLISQKIESKLGFKMTTFAEGLKKVKESYK